MTTPLKNERSCFFRVHPGSAVVKNEHSLYDGRMPKVSDAHRAARRRQILDAAGRCFARNGFHVTSMQDVFRESGLSAGAVYGYFPGKHAIVAAIAEEAVGELTGILDELAAAEPVPPLEATMARLLTAVDAYTATDGFARIAVQVWGEAIHDPALAGLVATAYRRLRSRFVDLARHAQAAGQLPAQADPERLGTVLFGLVPGYILQRLLLGDVDPAAYTAGLHALLGGHHPQAVAGA
jgi:AcrR family transcriptional regulator